jgi:hypothetical protein
MFLRNVGTTYTSSRRYNPEDRHGQVSVDPEPDTEFLIVNLNHLYSKGYLISCYRQLSRRPAFEFVHCKRFAQCRNHSKTQLQILSPFIYRDDNINKGIQKVNRIGSVFSLQCDLKRFESYI